MILIGQKDLLPDSIIRRNFTLDNLSCNVLFLNSGF